MAKKVQVGQTPDIEHRGFNLADADRLLEAEERGIEIHLKGPDRKTPLYFQNGKGAPQPVIWRTSGSYSDRFRRAEEAVAREQAEREENPMDPAVFQEGRLEVAARVSLPWDGFFDADGKPLRHDVETARKILRKYEWVLPQVRGGIGDHVGFQKLASGN